MSTLVTSSPPKLVRITDTQQREEFAISGINLTKVDSQSLGVSVSWFVVKDRNSTAVDPILNEFLESVVTESEAAVERDRLEGLEILKKAEIEDEMDSKTLTYNESTS